MKISFSNGNSGGRRLAELKGMTAIQRRFPYREYLIWPIPLRFPAMLYFCAILFIPFYYHNAKRQKYSLRTDHR
jgi:hypothetical protein